MELLNNGSDPISLSFSNLAIRSLMSESESPNATVTAASNCWLLIHSISFLNLVRPSQSKKSLMVILLMIFMALANASRSFLDPDATSPAASRAGTTTVPSVAAASPLEASTASNLSRSSCRRATMAAVASSVPEMDTASSTLATARSTWACRTSASICCQILSRPKGSAIRMLISFILSQMLWIKFTYPERLFRPDTMPPMAWTPKTIASTRFSMPFLAISRKSVLLFRISSPRSISHCSTIPRDSTKAWFFTIMKPISSFTSPSAFSVAFRAPGNVSRAAFAAPPNWLSSSFRIMPCAAIVSPASHSVLIVSFWPWVNCTPARVMAERFAIGSLRAFPIMTRAPLSPPSITSAISSAAIVARSKPSPRICLKVARMAMPLSMTSSPVGVSF